MLRTVNQLLSPGGARGRLAIMIFHRVPRVVDPMFPLEPDAARFERDMRNVRRWFHVLPLEAAVARLREGSLPARALAITFDDGYADNHDVALPILTRLNLTATFFIATSFLDGGCMWNDRVVEALRAFDGDSLDLTDAGLGIVDTGSLQARRSAVASLLGRLKYRPLHERLAAADAVLAAARVPAPERLMMTSDQVRRLADAGMSIGAHTHRHPILARLDEAESRDEIARSRDVLQGLLQAPVRLFAYPNGKPGVDYRATDVDHVRALGFTAACSTAPGVAGRDADPLQLPRFTPWDQRPWKFGMRMSSQLRRQAYAVA